MHLTGSEVDVNVVDGLMLIIFQRIFLSNCFGVSLLPGWGHHHYSPKPIDFIHRVPGQVIQYFLTVKFSPYTA